MLAYTKSPKLARTGRYKLVDFAWPFDAWTKVPKNIPQMVAYNGWLIGIPQITGKYNPLPETNSKLKNLKIKFVGSDDPASFLGRLGP